MRANDALSDHLSIDVIICTYNNCALLDRTLAAIAKLRVPPDVTCKVLVVDNNCTDDTRAVVEEHIRSGKIPDLAIVSEPRQGLTQARRRGVLRTTGDWIAFVDDDCLLAEDWVEQAIAFARAHLRCGALGGRVILDWEIPPPAFALQFKYSFAQQEYGTTARQVSCLVGAGMIVKRSALADSGWIGKPLLEDRVGLQPVFGGDVEIALRIHGAGYELWYNPACSLRHMICSGRMSLRYLIDVNYGLGVSHILGEAMLWPRSYPAWLLTSAGDVLRASTRVLIQASRAALGRGTTEEVAIRASFVRGQWAGVGRVHRMNARERRTLVGVAKVPAGFLAAEARM